MKKKQQGKLFLSKPQKEPNKNQTREDTNKQKTKNTLV
jgi:hypothetical protein